MARLILSEYAAKKLLIGEPYVGVSIEGTNDLSQLSLEEGQFVVKVDDGTKKRNQKGLVVLGRDKTRAVNQAKSFLESGYKRVLVEPLIEHKQEMERYLSCTLVRSGVEVLYSKTGGNEVEDRAGVIERHVPRANFLSEIAVTDGDIPSGVVDGLLSAMRQYNISFVEINPFINGEGDLPIFLDAAVELDSSKLHLLPEWVLSHIQNNSQMPAVEAEIKKLDKKSTASFSLTVFDKNAAVFTLLSGGGASLVVLDTFVDCGMQRDVANYGEYSGAPSREETEQYARAILSLLFVSTAARKVLVIAGGVANFTDVTTTFSGIIDSCQEYLEEFKKQSVMVIVRRGGPRQDEGLAMLKSFFIKHNISCIVSDPSMPLSQLAVEAKKFIEQTV